MNTHKELVERSLKMWVSKANPFMRWPDNFNDEAQAFCREGMSAALAEVLRTLEEDAAETGDGTVFRRDLALWLSQCPLSPPKASGP